MRHEDIPEINNPKIRFPVLEGDKLMKELHENEEVNQRPLTRSPRPVLVGSQVRSIHHYRSLS